VAFREQRVEGCRGESTRFLNLLRRDDRIENQCARLKRVQAFDDLAADSPEPDNADVRDA
jgi:hypothetical protein